MATAIIDGITTRYEVQGSGPPLLMYAPGGFNAIVETWSTQGVRQDRSRSSSKKYTASCSTGANAASRAGAWSA